MRIVLYSVLAGFLFFAALTSANAQQDFYPGGSSYYPGGLWSAGYPPTLDTVSLNRKWSLTKFVGISASRVFFNGGEASVLSAPVGLQLNRRLNDNLYAFTRLSAAPAYISFNVPFNSTQFNKNPGLSRGTFNNLGLQGRAELGLMYINDQKTFSISGSLGIERNSYPYYLPVRMPHQSGW